MGPILDQGLGMGSFGYLGVKFQISRHFGVHRGRLKRFLGAKNAPKTRQKGVKKRVRGHNSAFSGRVGVILGQGLGMGSFGYFGVKF